MHSIKICMGSSCFAHGSPRLLEVIRTFIDGRDCGDTVELAGSLCRGECGNGPVVEINGRIYTRLTPSDCAQLLNGLDQTGEHHV